MRLIVAGEDEVDGLAGRPRRHDGAPLRLLLVGHRLVADVGVVPVVTTGLHCGDAVMRAARVTSSGGRPRRHDGAPLRRDRGRQER